MTEFSIEWTAVLACIPDPRERARIAERHGDALDGWHHAPQDMRSAARSAAGAELEASRGEGLAAAGFARSAEGTNAGND